MLIYLTYAPEDREFADYLAYRLRQAGVPIWIDLLDAPQDDETLWEAARQEAYNRATMMVVILTPEACQFSPLLEEWHAALEHRLPVIGAVALPCVPSIPLKKYADFTRDFEQGYHRFMHVLFEQAQRSRSRF